jgi:hypothetical protein
MQSPPIELPTSVHNKLTSTWRLILDQYMLLCPPVANATPLAHVCTAIAFAVAFEAAQCHRVWQHAVCQDA